MYYIHVCMYICNVCMAIYTCTCYILYYPNLQAVECDRYSALTKLLLIANDVNTQNNLGYTPLHYAAIQDNVMAANKLLDKGAFTDHPDEVTI